MNYLKSSYAYWDIIYLLPKRSRRYIKLCSAFTACIMLSACASFSQDGGFAVVQQAATDQLHKDVQWIKSDADQRIVNDRNKELLAQPLSVDAAVQLALLNNKGLQASFDTLGIAESDLVQAGRMTNPGFSFSRLRRGDEVEFDRGISFNIARLIAMPLTSKMERHRFEQTQRQVMMEMLIMAAETRKAYFIAVAAEESVRYLQQVKKSAEAGAELAKRMKAAGNFNALQEARELSFYSDAVLNLARADQARIRSRERLIRLLGIDQFSEENTGVTSFKLPERLPDLPDVLTLTDVKTESDEEATVINKLVVQRLDVQAAKLNTQQLAESLGLNKVTRFINVLELGGVRNTSNQQATQHGYEVRLELPLFDWGTARTAKAEALYMQAVNQASQTALEARSEIRVAYANYRASYDIARHYRDEVVPLKKRISQENQLRYNGMFISVFDLLADARSQITSVNSAIDALKDFWLAQADLEMSMTGKPSMTSSQSTMISVSGSAAEH